MALKQFVQLLSVNAIHRWLWGFLPLGVRTCRLGPRWGFPGHPPMEPTTFLPFYVNAINHLIYRLHQPQLQNELYMASNCDWFCHIPAALKIRLSASVHLLCSCEVPRVSKKNTIVVLCWCPGAHKFWRVEAVSVALLLTFAPRGGEGRGGTRIWPG